MIVYFLFLLPQIWWENCLTNDRGNDCLTSVDCVDAPFQQVNPIQRKHDVYIMDSVLEGGFSPAEIRQINHCRLYLQASTMSNICLCNGVTLNPDMLQGIQGPTSSTSSWVKIKQAKPHAASWKLWQRACTQWSLNGKLLHPLGDWLAPSIKLRRTWPIHYDYHHGNLFIRTTTGFTRCVPMDTIRFSPISEVSHLPGLQCHPVTTCLTIQGTAWIQIIPVLPILIKNKDITATFTEFLETLDVWE
jgi:hypothetical protein